MDTPEARGRNPSFGHAPGGRTPILLGVALAALSSCAFGPTYEGAVSDHFDGERFHNPTPMDRDFLDFIRWRLTREPGEWEMDLSKPNANEIQAPPERVSGKDLRITLVNHATLLLQTGGLNLLTDPHWSERASPVSFAGPRRHRAPGVAFDDLPPIDVVLVSHNHYDHMDLPTIERLEKTHAPRFVVPLGNRAYLECADASRITELDWWQHVSLSDRVTVHAVPAQHWSKRRLFDANRALWAGFYLEGPAGTAYFAGDTGMGGHFAAIRERLGPPTIAMLPIGAYKPRWFMGSVHTSPAEAIEAHRRLASRYLVPMHFGTFPVGDDAQHEPLRDLRRAMSENAVDPERVWILDNGESRRLSERP